MMKKNNNTNKLLVQVIILILVFLMGFIFYMQFDHRRDLMAGVKKAGIDLEENNSTLLSLEVLKNSLDKTQNTARIYDELLPKNADKNELLGFFQELAVNSNVEFTKVAFDPEVPKEGYTEIPVKLTYTGNYNCLMDLLNSMEKGRRFVCIDSISMKSDSLNITKVNLDVSVRAFYSVK